MATSPCQNPGPGVIRVPGVLDIEGEIVPWVVGVPLTSVLLGIILLQASSYFGRYGSRDSWYFRATVGILLLGSLAIWGVVVSDLYYVAVTARDSDCTLALTPPRMFVPIASIPFFAAISQGFFAKRCHRITGGNIFVAVLFGVMIAAGFGCGLFAIYSLPHGGKPIPMDDTSASLFPIPTNPKDINAAKTSELNIRFGMLSAFSIMAATDVTISIVLIAKLSSMRQHWNERTDTILTRLCAFSVVTGAITSLVAGVDAVILPLELRFNNYPYILSMLLPFLYTICPIASLNLRSNLGIQGETEPNSDRTPHSDPYSRAGATGRRKSLFGSNHSHPAAYFPGSQPQDREALGFPMQARPGTGTGPDRANSISSLTTSMPVAPSAKFGAQGQPPLPGGAPPAFVLGYGEQAESLDGHRDREKGYWAV